MKGCCPNVVMAVGRKKGSLTRRGDGECVQNCVLRVRWE